MFSNGTKQFIPNMFMSKLHKSSLCDYCKEKDSIVDYYVQTPSYYRNKSSRHCFMCSQECYNNFCKYNTCNRCGYAENLIFIPEENYSLCTNYPFNISCYDKLIKLNHFDDETAICSFCKIRAEFDWKEIDDDISVNICHNCDEIYKEIVLWSYQYNSSDFHNCCVFCKTTDLNMHKINRYNEDYTIIMCESCHTNYKYLVGQY